MIAYLELHQIINFYTRVFIGESVSPSYFPNNTLNKKLIVTLSPVKPNIFQKTSQPSIKVSIL